MRRSTCCLTDTIFPLNWRRAIRRDTMVSWPLLTILRIIHHPEMCEQSSYCRVTPPKINWRLFYKETLHHFERRSKNLIYKKWLLGRMSSPAVWMYNISTAPKKKLTQVLSCADWMLLEDDQRKFCIQSLLISMCLSLLLYITINSAGTHNSSLAWGTTGGCVGICCPWSLWEAQCHDWKCHWGICLLAVWVWYNMLYVGSLRRFTKK